MKTQCHDLQYRTAIAQVIHIASYGASSSCLTFHVASQPHKLLISGIYWTLCGCLSCSKKHKGLYTLSLFIAWIS